MSLKKFGSSLSASRFSLRRTFTLGIILLLLVPLLWTPIPAVAAGSVWTRSNFAVAKAGDTVSFDISLSVYSGTQIDGWSGDIYTLAVTGMPSGWKARFYLGNVEITSAINIRVDETVTIKLEVVTSSNTDSGDYSITFIAYSSLTGWSLSLPLTVRVRLPVRHIDISSAYPFLSKRAGEVLSYPVTIVNDGEKEELLTLDATLPQGWSACFLTASGNSIRGLSIEPNHSQQLTVEFNPPGFVEAGTLNFTIVVKSEDGYVKATLNLWATILSTEREVFIDSSFIDISMQKGQSISLPITLNNKGCRDEQLNLSASVPDGWQTIFKLDGVKVQSVYLKAGSSRSLSVELTPPPTVAIGHFQIEICIFSSDRAVNTTKTFFVNILPLDRKVSITTAYPCVQLEQGQSISCPVTISNEGTCNEQLNLSVTTPKGWQGAFKATSGMGGGITLNTIYLSAGSTISLVFEATPTQEYEPGEYAFTLMAASVDGVIQASSKLKINVIPRIQQIFSCQLPMKVIQPGETAKFQVGLTNPSFKGQAFNISVNDMPTGWNAKIKTSGGESIQVINVNAGETVTLTVEFSTPTNARNGTYIFVLTAKSEWLLEKLTLSVRVQSPSAGIELKAVPPYLDTYGGAEAKFKIQLSNTGGLDELLNLTVEGLPPEFRAIFKDSAGQQITAIYVEAGQSKDIYLVISTPTGQELGVRSFKVSTFNAEIREDVDLTLNVLGFYKIELTNQNFYTSTNVGGEAAYTLYVKNAGNMEIANVKVAVTGSTPEGFTVSISPDSIKSLGIKGEASFIIAIKTESDINAGNYYVNFQVTSDQTDSLPFTLRVEVFQTTSWILYAGIIFVVAVVALFLIYRKFGRR
ncbi:MAG: NEW3 domain-containing protein [Candidatus Bathyarchaeia archaeon]